MSARRNQVRVCGHFWAAELECPHCGQVMLDPVLLCRLELLRIAWGYPLTLSSGYRCVVHNANPKVGGRADSRHLSGRAVDIPLEEVDPATGRTTAAIVTAGAIPRYELERFRSRAVAAGFRAADVVDEGDHVHLEVD